EGKTHEPRPYLRRSVRRASGFVLTGYPEIIPSQKSASRRSLEDPEDLPEARFRPESISGSADSLRPGRKSAAPVDLSKVLLRLSKVEQ
ncbi:MAG: hypothetical protein ABSE40_24025, partial [Candidatus Sulfotelmatobacter sp.]